MVDIKGKKIKFLTTTGRLDTNFLVREAWVDDHLVSILENINNEWLISFTPENLVVGLNIEILDVIHEDFLNFLSEIEEKQ